MKLKAYRTSILLGVSFTVVLSTFWFFPQFAFVLFISLLLQLLLTPVVDRLGTKIPRALASAVVLIAFIVLAGCLLFLISNSFIPTLTNFISDFPELTAQLQDSIVQKSNFFSKELDSLWEELRVASVDALKSSLGILISVFNKVIDLILILFITFYLLKDGEMVKSYIARLFPTSDYDRVLALFNKILSSLRAYICGQLCICLITGTIVFTYYTVRDLPYASVFAMLSAIAEFVPVLGPTVASALGTMMTATEDIWVAVQTMFFYLILTQCNHNIVYPMIIGRSLNLHPVAIILGIILGGELMGAPGMFLAVPFIVIVKLVIEDIFRDSKATSARLKSSRWLQRKHEE